MTIREVKQFFFDLISEYHPMATVVWAKTNGVTPKQPFITLSYGNMERAVFPINNADTETYYNCSMRFEVNLYTVGRYIENINAYENTAIEDLEEFTRFIDSDPIIDKMGVNNITILLDSPINDLSELVGDTKFNYRSMAEFVVSFVEKAAGRYGVTGVLTLPNPSGGGRQEYEGAETYEIEEIGIEEGIENEYNQE